MTRANTTAQRDEGLHGNTGPRGAGTVSPGVVGPESMLEVEFSLAWTSPGAAHEERLHVPRFNVWRDLDLLPPPLQSQVLGQAPGHAARQLFPAGAAVDGWNEHALIGIPPVRFERIWRKRFVVEPRLGRFYPRGLLKGVPGVFSEDSRPVRLVALGADGMTFDFNHPLSRHPLEVAVEVGPLVPHDAEHGGRCNDCVAELAAGPGMQVRWGDVATDFYTGAAFDRSDPSPDGIFYSITRMVNHLDREALTQVEELYGRLVRPGSRILDLMASWNSHLPETLFPAPVAGLGMNREELEANPVLTERVVADLNTDPVLPWREACFDAVVCTVSVEYLTRPLEVFREVARVLRPGGIFILTFSNRWFPTKAVRLWQDLHEFERLGLVLDYFRQDGSFGRLNTFSSRGRPRPEDDPHIRQSQLSDPIYAVWGARR